MENEFEANANLHGRYIEIRPSANHPLLLAVLQFFTTAEIESTTKTLVAWLIRGLVAGSIGGGRAGRSSAKRLSTFDGQNKVYRRIVSRFPADDPHRCSVIEESEPLVLIVVLSTPNICFAIEKAFSGTKEPELVPNEDVDAINLEHILPRNAKSAVGRTFCRKIEVFAFRIRYIDFC